MHHIISDHWSMGVFGRELTALYKAFAQKHPSLVGEPTTQFADYACWERQLLDNGLLNGQLAYWKTQLAGPLPQLEFRADVQEHKASSFRTSRQAVEFDEAIFTRVKSLARKDNCTPFMVMVTALGVVLYGYTGQQNIRIGTLVANRNRRDSEGVIGLIVNSVILCIQIYPEITFNRLLKHVREVTLSAYVHQELPFECLARVLEEEKALDRDSLFQVLLIYNAVSLPVIKLPGLTFAPLDLRSIRAETEVTISTFDLVFNMNETSTKLTGSVNYKSDKFEATFVENMGRGLFAALQNMIANPEKLVSRIVTEDKEGCFHRREP
jgi:hypothetical protein